LSCDRSINYKDAVFAGKIVNACCVLHNYCTRMRVPNPPPLLENIDENEPPEFNNMPHDLVQRGLDEMRFLINYANQRQNDRNVANNL